MDQKTVSRRATKAESAAPVTPESNGALGVEAGRGPASAKPKAQRGRPKTGTIVRTKDGRWQAFITLADGSRKRLAPCPPGTTKARARERAAAHSDHATQVGSRARPKKALTHAHEAGEKWWDAFFAQREAKGLSPVRFMYTTHIKPALANTHPAEWTREDCEKLVAALDAKVVFTGKGKISWKSAANAWGLFTTACKVACSAKAGPALRVRTDNPCAGVEGPERGEKKEKQWLYPSELSKLLACEDVPLRWRQLYAVLTYTYVRPGELRALDWSDVDLEVGTIHICKAWDEKRKRVKVPKTRAGVRYVPIEPTLLPLLRALRPHAGVGSLSRMGPMEDWAERFRRHLKVAGIDRAELFTGNELHKQITLYDLRATGITWRCLRKDYGPEIQQAAGHEKYDTTDGYIRTARVFFGRVGEPFPPLPEGLLGGQLRSPISFNETQVRETIVTPAGIEPALPA